ncbi:MAG: DUF6367 family protein [Ignavibacteria bacterium]
MKLNKKYLRELIREVLFEISLENTYYQILIKCPRKYISQKQLLAEGIWQKTNCKDYWKRLDRPKNDFEFLHVHISHAKHITSKNKQVAWNNDGARHDRKSFDSHFKGMQTAKEIARKELNIPPDVQLENIFVKGKNKLLLETGGMVNNIDDSKKFIFVINQ